MTDYKTIAESNSFIVLDKYTKAGQVAESYQSEYDLERELIEDLQNQCHVFADYSADIISSTNGRYPP